MEEMKTPRQGHAEPLHVRATDYAGSYLSPLFHPERNLLAKRDLDVLQHVNCSYLSSGKPPTLLALKQHAHSLVNLIGKLSPTLSSAAADNRYGSNSWFTKNESFDWLNNLGEPYDNEDESHHVPLWALLNQVKEEREQSDGSIVREHHCPLDKFNDFGPLAEEGTLRRPYGDHHNLVKHANECLEILDHEYSATGGLLSLLPVKADKNSREMAAARNTLLGQWLLHHQHLVARMHELEINYANSLDVLSGEAIVPFQMMMQRQGLEGPYQGRAIAYPQDKFILANAGDDFFSHLHRLMDKEEAQIERKEKIWQKSGVSGDRLWVESRNGESYAHGLVPVDLVTRFYRIKGRGKASTVFVLPGIEEHPGVQETRKMEERPTVFSVVTPTWPERVSEWETKHKAHMEKGKQAETLNQELMRNKIEMQHAIAVKNSELHKNRRDLAFYEKTLGQTGKKKIDDLLDVVAKWEDKMKELKGILPSEYHKHLSITQE